MFFENRTCKRLCCLTKRTKFWYRMNGMKYDTQFCNETEANGFLNYLNRQTCEFRIASTGSKSQILVADSLTRLIDVGRNLTVLALENQKLSNVDFRSRMLTRSLRVRILNTFFWWCLNCIKPKNLLKKLTFFIDYRHRIGF